MCWMYASYSPIKNVNLDVNRSCVDLHTNYSESAAVILIWCKEKTMYSDKPAIFYKK
jgi:hypothetical protein